MSFSKDLLAVAGKQPMSLSPDQCAYCDRRVREVGHAFDCPWWRLTINAQQIVKMIARQGAGQGEANRE